MRRPSPASGVAILLSILVRSGCLFQTSPRVEPRPTAWAEHPSQHLKNWHKLDEDVYRSEQPDRKGFIEIRDRGIKTVVNLRSHHSDDSKAGDLGLILVRVPMTAAGFSEADIVAALKAIQSAAKPVDFPVATTAATADWKVRCTGIRECLPYITLRHRTYAPEHFVPTR